MELNVSRETEIMLLKLSSLNIIALHPVFTESLFIVHDILQQRPAGRTLLIDKFCPCGDPLMN